jgi:hypothetical protein
MAPTELRETSYRAIARVLRTPSVEGPLGLAACELLPMGPDTHYLRCGAGFGIYNVRGTVAHMHGALLPGDGAKAPQAFREHFAYLRGLGVELVTTRHRAEHRRASLMCRVLGFQSAACDAGFKRYEKVIHG